MRIDGESGWVELLQRDDEEAFDVRCSVGDFAGRNARIWIDASEQRRFLAALRALERDRRGEARLAAMSPQDFELTVRIVDALGHVGVAGTVGRHQEAGRGYDRLAFTFSFTVDPTRLPTLVQDMADLVEAA